MDQMAVVVSKLDTCDFSQVLQPPPGVPDGRQSLPCQLWEFDFSGAGIGIAATPAFTSHGCSPTLF